MKVILLFIMICFVQTGLLAQRETKTINEGWWFHKGELPVSFINDKWQEEEWERINLPHTWSTDAYTVKDYYKGVGWYRKSFALPEEWKGKQLFLKFEGASKSALVYVNGKPLEEHRGGYSAFTMDITPYCSWDSENELCVMVDNSRQDIPPISADFTFAGGIYRDAWLIAVPKQHFELLNYGSNGIFISTPEVSEQQASLTVKGEIRNEEPIQKSVQLEINLFDPEGNRIQQQKKNIRLRSGEKYGFDEKLKAVNQPRLWSPETPELYTVETVIRDGKSGQELDRISSYTGFRWFHFDGREGFFLNGKPYKLRGMCRHQDQKPVGVALTDEMHRRDMLLMKEMGTNFIRISHYPQDEAIIEQCDKLGMLAWEEIPVIDVIPDSDEYYTVCEETLKEMIRQHYNHPSVIMWGYMNEILLVTQRRYRTPEEFNPVLDRTLALIERLEKIVKEEDPYRPSVMAFHGSNVYNETGISKMVDIVGWNLYSGWYGGDLFDFDRFLANQQKNYPDHPLIVSEYGAGSDKRLHSLKPRSFDFSIEYQQKYLEHYLPVMEREKYVAGSAHWNFIDFSSALRDESMPRINNKGLVYSDRTPKDVYYYYKAMFRKDIPVLYIASRDWEVRSGIQQGDAPVVLPVKVYTNLPEVELFMGSNSLGKKKVENCNAVFDVPFTTGTHLFRAVAAANGKTCEDGMNITFHAIPDKLTPENIKHLELAVNVGSDCNFTGTESHLTWIADRCYKPGGWGYIPLNDSIPTLADTKTEIKNTWDNPLYQTLRTNLEAYRFDVPQGDYEVELLFADIYNNTEEIPYLLSARTDAGNSSNCFHIYINGKKVEDAFSVVDAAGAFHAVNKRYVVRVQEGALIVKLETLSGINFMNGIKLRKL